MCSSSPKVEPRRDLTPSAFSSLTTHNPRPPVPNSSNPHKAFEPRSRAPTGGTSTCNLRILHVLKVRRVQYQWIDLSKYIEEAKKEAEEAVTGAAVVTVGRRRTVVELTPPLAASMPSASLDEAESPALA